jgi:hypothetical protein
MSTLIEYAGVNQADQGMDMMTQGRVAAGLGLVSLAVVGNVPGGRAVGKVDDAVEALGEAVSGAATAVHGNARASMRAQHRYEIVDETGDVVKTGISGSPLNANGTSRRANTQVNALNRANNGRTYSARIAETNIPGRQAGLDAERAATYTLARDGNTLGLQQRPKP